MGCGGSKVEDEETNENTHKVIAGEKMEKENGNPNSFQNKYINELTVYFKDQKPPESGEFKDEVFPPNNNSLYGKDKDGNWIDTCSSRRSKALSQIKVQEQDIVWLRAKEFYGEDVKLFSDAIQIDDITQGKVGDCYFIATISALAEFPKLVSQLFKTKTLQENGCVEIALQIDGEWKIICLDDYFPCDKTTKTPIFASSKSKELWPLFLEKAWAKVNGGYANIIAGDPRDVFQAFTPFAAVPIEIAKENKKTLWENIRDADAYNCIMTASIDEGVSGLVQVGLLANHTFSLVSAFERKIGEETVHLMKLRNPLGEGEWIGDWSDKSAKWTEEAKTAFPEFDANTKNDGIFWISYEDFIKYFSTVCLCVPVKPLCTSTYKVDEEKAKGFNVIKLKMLGDGVLNVDVKKPSYRFSRDIQPDSSVIDNIILVRVDKENKKFEYLDSACNEPLSEKVTAGEYIIYYNVDYAHGKSDKIRPYNLNISSNAKFQFFQTDNDDDFSLLRSIIEPRLQLMEKYKKRFEAQNLIFFTGNRFEKTSIGFGYFKNPQKKVIYIKSGLSLKNMTPLEGKTSLTVKLDEGKSLLFLANRIVASKPFQTGVSVKILERRAASFIEPVINQEKIEKYLTAEGYADPKFDFELE